MLKTLSICAALIALSFLSCKDLSKKDNTIQDDSQAIEKANTETKVIETKTPLETYCEVTFAGDTQKAEYELRSSNALKKGQIATTFSIVTPKTIYEKHPLELDFVMHHTTDEPRLTVGNYAIKSLVAVDNSGVPYFSFITAVDETTYQNAIAANLIEDIIKDYVILAHANNILTITSVKDIGKVNDGSYYKTGQQRIVGQAEVSLLKVATKEKLQLKLNFNSNHDWTIRK